MDQIHNTTPVTPTIPPEEKISTFDIKDTNNLIISIINAPVGKVAVKSSFYTINAENAPGTSIPLGHSLFTGSIEEIIKNLATASLQVLLKGAEKNPEQKKQIITRN
jgi:hypothetical protein